MIPYMHPEFVKALTSPATDKSAKDASPDVSPRPLPRKRKDQFAPLRRIAAHRLRSLIVAVAAKLILLLIYVCL
jgi:hypothetical protein